MANERKIQKLESVLKEVVARIIDQEIDFFDTLLVTVTRAHVSDDRRYATVFISVLGGSEKTALEILKKNVYPIQQQVNRQLRIRPIPQIRFALDEAEIAREGVEKSLVKLKRSAEA